MLTVHTHQRHKSNWIIEGIARADIDVAEECGWTPQTLAPGNTAGICGHKETTAGIFVVKSECSQNGPV